MKHQKSRKYITSAFKNWSKSAEALKNQGLPLLLFINVSMIFLLFAQLGAVLFLVFCLIFLVFFYRHIQAGI